MADGGWKVSIKVQFITSQNNNVILYIYFKTNMCGEKKHSAVMDNNVFT